MTNKNPYEIRLEVLQLAHGLECEKTHRENDRLTQDWHAAFSFASEKKQEAPPHPKLNVVQAEDVVDTAKYLLGFVEEARKFNTERL